MGQQLLWHGRHCRPVLVPPLFRRFGYGGDGGWGIRYLVVDTRNWWAGQHVLVSPLAVREIKWGDRQMLLDITREKIKASPPWEAPPNRLDPIYAGQSHAFYGWPSYGV